MSSFRQLMMKEKGGGGLPDTYEQLNYIATNGIQYIDVGLIPTSETRVVTKIKPNVPYASYQNIPVFGIFSNYGSEHYHLTPFANKWYYGANPSEGNAGSYVYSEIYEIDYNNNGQLIINGTLLVSSFDCGQEGSLLISRKGQPSDNLYGRFYYYYFQVYQSGTLVRDMIPVKRKADNVLGMFDLVNQVFYTNSGSGSFIGG